MKNIQAVSKLLLFVLHCLWVFPAQGTVVLLFKEHPISFVIPRIWNAMLCRIFGIKVEIVGTPIKDKQALFLPNHISYMDIPVMGAAVKAAFVSKSEVKSWPVLGAIGTLARTAYIVRKRSQSHVQKNELQKRIDLGESFIIFPEGTSTNGESVLPFKSSLFELAIGQDDLFLQPVTISVISVDGKPVNSARVRDQYTWHGDMELMPHVWQFSKMSGAHVKLRFHPPIQARNYEDRKTLANEAHKAVVSGLETHTEKL